MGPCFLFRIPLSSPPVECGDNEFGVRLTNRVGMIKTMLNVQDVEIKLDVQ